MAVRESSTGHDPIIQGLYGRLGRTKPTKASLVVNCSQETKLTPQQLWQTFSDLEKWKRWTGPIVSNTRWLEGRSFDVGSRFELDRHFGFPVGRQVTVETVREVVPGQSVVWWDGSGGIRNCHMWSFEPLPDGGTLIRNAEVLVGPVVLLARPILRKRLHRLFQQSVEGLVRAAEREHA